MSTTSSSVVEALPSLDPGSILQLGLGFWGSKTLLSAVELGVFTALGAGSLTVEELRARLGLAGRGAADFLDALVALGMLDRADGRYSNTRATAAFLDRSSPAYVGGILEMANARLYPFWGSLTEALQTGKPQSEIKSGGDFFGAVYADPDRLAQFMSSMTGLSMGCAHAIAEQFPWADHRVFVDIGGAEGAVAVAVAERHGHITGGNFDLPPVRPLFERYVERAGLTPRLRFHGGDFFTDEWPAADVYSLGHVLHDWDLDGKLALLRKAYRSLPEGGAVIVFDAIIDDERRVNAFGLLMSLNMLIEVPGGFDYTAADCQAWMREAGFRTTSVQHLAGPDSMVVGIK